MSDETNKNARITILYMIVVYVQELMEDKPVDIFFIETDKENIREKAALKLFSLFPEETKFDELNYHMIFFPVENETRFKIRDYTMSSSDKFLENLKEGSGIVSGEYIQTCFDKKDE